ncbi:CYFIP-related Rac1 interactor B-like isoform X4 [Phascolarctos cinereus]
MLGTQLGSLSLSSLCEVSSIEVCWPWATSSRYWAKISKTVPIFSWILKMRSPQKRRQLCGTRSAPSWRKPRASWQNCSPILELARRFGRPSKTQLTSLFRRRHGMQYAHSWSSSNASMNSPFGWHLEREQALAKQFAEILHFTLSFDELKMTNPAIQNDFSYYRRTISRNRINNLQLDAESEVNNEMANRMSLFYAEATPMLKTLSNATTKFVSENKTLPIEDTTDCLSTMACVCRVMLETPYTTRHLNDDTTSKQVRALLQ